MLANLASAVRGWVERPFREDMDLIGWFLFGAIVVASLMFWRIVLGDIRGEL
jgi:hypothetical protein